MINHIPHIHLFELYKEKYFYDINTNGIVSISEGVYNFLKRITKIPSISKQQIIKEYNQINMEEQKDIDFLLSQGYLLDFNENVKFQHAETNRLDAFYKTNLNTITLQVTQNCNLRCKYCVYSGSYVNRIHSNKRMSLETAINAIKFLYERSANSDAISIGFYGGEPLLEYELIEKCVEYAEKIFAGKKLSFNMTSNGTLLNEKNIMFLAEHKFNLTISLDGPASIQNRNRIFAGSNKGTYETIMDNLELVKAICPSYIHNITFNAVIDLQQDVSCTSEYFMSYDLVKEIGVSGNYVDSNNLKDQDEDEIPPEFYANSNYEVFKIYLSSCTHLLKDYRTSLYSFHLSYINNLIKERAVISSHENCMDCPGGQCLPGIQRFFVNVEGRFYPCERVNESSEALCIGNIEDGFNIDNAKAILNVAQISESECKKCWCYKLCEQCCGKAENNGKLDKNKRLLFCLGTKATVEDSIKNYIVLKKHKSKLI